MIKIPKGLVGEILHSRNVLAKFGQGAFFAHSTDPQAIATGEGTSPSQVTVGTEIIDVNSWFASNKFTPKQPGYYLLFGHIIVTPDADFATDESDIFMLYLRKNGATPAYYTRTHVRGTPLHVLAILEANGTTDYFDLAAHSDGTADPITIDEAWFGGVFVSYNNP